MKMCFCPFSKMAQVGLDKLFVFLFLISIQLIPSSSQSLNSTVTIFPSPSPSVVSSSFIFNWTTSIIANATSSSSIYMTATPTLTSIPGTHNATTMIPTSTAVMNSTTSIRPMATSTVIPSTSSVINFTTVQPPTTARPTTDCHVCEEMLASERHYKWAAVSFDIIFALALVVMTIMYLRQRKMYREMEGDGSLSRLI